SCGHRAAARRALLALSKDRRKLAHGFESGTHVGGCAPHLAAASRHRSTSSLFGLDPAASACRCTPIPPLKMRAARACPSASPRASEVRQALLSSGTNGDAAAAGERSAAPSPARPIGLPPPGRPDPRGLLLGRLFQPHRRRAARRPAPPAGADAGLPEAAGGGGRDGRGDRDPQALLRGLLSAAGALPL